MAHHETRQIVTLAAKDLTAFTRRVCDAYFSACRDVIRTYMVRAHRFQWRDQPLTSRFFGNENHWVGLIDLADAPSPELTATSREPAGHMYAVRSNAAVSAKTGAAAP